jgi:hypothetical protein
MDALNIHVEREFVLLLRVALVTSMVEMSVDRVSEVEVQDLMVSFVKTLIVRVT